MSKPRKGVIPPHLRPYLFKKKGKAKSMGKRAKATKAITVYKRSAPVVVTRTRRVKVPVRVRSKAGAGRSLMKREHGSGEMMPGPFRMRSAAVAGLIGYAEAGKGLTQLADLLNKLPSVGKLPKEAIAGLVLNYFADRGDWVDSGAQAFLDVGAYKLGQQGFSISGDDDDY